MTESFSWMGYYLASGSLHECFAQWKLSHNIINNNWNILHRLGDLTLNKHIWLYMHGWWEGFQVFFQKKTKNQPLYKTLNSSSLCEFIAWFTLSQICLGPSGIALGNFDAYKLSRCYPRQTKTVWDRVIFWFILTGMAIWDGYLGWIL